jgi:hypothetical protein
MYPTVENVVASYFSGELDLSKEEAITELKHDLDKSDIWKSRYKNEVLIALDDLNYSWQTLLTEWAVDNVFSEDQAREAARELFFEAIFSEREETQADAAGPA